jgi:thiamine-phosphate pyrophosphorylase
VVTDERGSHQELVRFLDDILSAGCDVVQLRSKDAEAGDLLRWATVFREASDRHGALFFVNDRPDVALAGGADGVHVGQNDLPPSFVRELVGDEVLIGLSCHSKAQLDERPAEADYVTAGPIHPTPTKPGRPGTGIDVVRHATATVTERPWFAIGGLDPSTLPEAVEAGARRIVVVRAVTEAEDPATAVRSLLEALPALAED